jgi:hypothetical protein
MKKKLTRILGVGLTVSLLASLVLAAAPVGAITQPSVTLDDNDISATALYGILFTVSDHLALADDIIVEFPEGTDITGITDAVDADVVVSATSGIGTDAFGPLQAATTQVDETLTIDLPDDIGVGALVFVEIDGVVNPDTPGEYTLDVSTTAEDAVTSTTYELDAPDIGELPGIVQRYNPGGILMEQYTGAGAIQAAVDDCGGEDWVVKVGPGTYTENVVIDNLGNERDGLVFEASGAVEDTKIIGDLFVDSNTNDVTIEGLTFRGEMDIEGYGSIVEDCVFEKDDDSAGETLLTYDGDASVDAEIVNCSFDTTAGSVDDVGLYIYDDGLTVSGCSFTVDEDDWGIELYYDAIVEDCTFTGNSGIGIYLEDEIGEISGCTFDGLENAFWVYDDDDGSLISGNTIKNCTGDAIFVDGIDSDILRIVNNDIMDTDEDHYHLNVEDDADQVLFLFNNVTGTGMCVNNDSGATLNASHNYWGGGSACDTDGDVDTSAPLGAPVTDAGISVGVDELTAVGVDVEVTDGWTDEVMGVAAYDDDPAGAYPMSPYLTDAGIPESLIDVYVHPDDDIDEVTIKIPLGSDRLSEQTAPYVWSELQGQWVQASWWGVSLFGGYVWVKVDDGTTPALEDLSGIPMVLLETPVDPDMIDITAPSSGATGVLMENTAFTWTSIEGADTYMIVLSANADLGSPLVREFTSGTAYTHPGPLDYSTPYYVQVVATSEGMRVGVSDVTTFTTMGEPAPPPEPDTIVVNPPPAPDVTVNIPPEPTPEPEATPAYIWVIIGIGAVLIIGVLVLIIRTRRAA